MWKSLVLVLVLCGISFGIGWTIRPSPPGPVPPPPTVTQIRYLPRTVYDTIVRTVFRDGPTVYVTDTLEVVYERLVTDTLYLGWNLPGSWYVDRLAGSLTPADTMDVSLVRIEADSVTGVTLARSLERIWQGGGCLTALEAGPAGVRYDFTPLPEPKRTPGWLRWAERGALFVGGFWLGSQ